MVGCMIAPCDDPELNVLLVLFYPTAGAMLPEFENEYSNIQYSYTRMCLTQSNRGFRGVAWEACSFTCL